MRRFPAVSLVWLAACGGGAQVEKQDLARGAPGGSDLAFDEVDLASDQPDLATDDLLAPSIDLARSAYPAGPYGNAIGSVLPPIAWEGYLNPSARGVATLAPYGKLAMNDLRISGKRIGLLYAADDF